MFRADSELMAADMFTKHFPESKRLVWNNNLKLINVIDSTNAGDIDYNPNMVQSLRGDLDAPKVVNIQDASFVALASPKGKPDKDAGDDLASTVCPAEDDRMRDFDDADDDRKFNDEWHNEEWTSDYDLS